MVNRLTPAEVRLVISAVEDRNDYWARNGMHTVDVVRLRRALRG